MRAIIDYFARLADGFGQGWTRFWFTPSDPTTLSAMRLLLGLVLVYLHATLSLDLIELFGSRGLLPVADISPLEVDTVSYLDYLSARSELWIVHLAGLVVLAMFAAGYWTRVTSVLALVVFLADVNRAVVITSRTETVAAMLLCYLCLAPCGRRFSIDRLLERRAAAAANADTPIGAEFSTSATIATRLIQIHFALLIAMMFFSQLSGDVWWNGTAMWWLIARPESRLVDFSWLYAHPRVIDFWSHAIVLFEICFSVLIWIPLARPLLLALGAVIWASLALVTGEITFALVLWIASLAFVSPDWMRSTLAAPARPVPVSPA